MESLRHPNSRNDLPKNDMYKSLSESDETKFLLNDVPLIIGTQIKGCWKGDGTTALDILFNLIQDGGQKGPPTNFSSVTFTNVGISPQNFVTFSFKRFATLV